MAEIDKALPNVRQSVTIPPEEETIEVTEEKIQEQMDPGVDVIEEEDGSVTVDFEPGKVAPQDSGEHFGNLAELLPDDVLGPLASDLVELYKEDNESRSEWINTYRKGLGLLGYKYEERTEPFQGASGATHPVLAEAVTQFQAQAYKELLPSDGPVRTQIVGMADRMREDQAQRVKDFMNYEIMNKMEEYDQELDQMLFYLPLAGSTFKKVYYDEMLGRAVSKFIPADDLVVPYYATSLQESERITHVVKMTHNELRKAQVKGFYKDIDLHDPAIIEDQLQKTEEEISGVKRGAKEEVYNILEMHVDLDLEGFEDQDPTGEPSGIKVPYIVTIEESQTKILAIRRNYNPDDPLKHKIKYFVHFKFLPGLGFYGLGLIHMIGGLSRTATSALRQLLDAGTLSNLPAGFKSRGIRIRDDAVPLQPGEWRDVDSPGGTVKEGFMTLPYKEPSQTLFNLLGYVVDAGQRFAGIADMQVGDGNQAAAVGTTVALLERGSRVMSAIHKRLYSGMKEEFNLLAKIFKLYLPPEYPYDVVGGNRMIKTQDFDDRVDIVPVADPNIFSMSQRVTLAQTELQLAQTNPEMHNMYEAYRSMYQAMGVKNIDQILPPPQPDMPLNPAQEHINGLAGKPFQAYRGQDHRAHITAHLAFMSTSLVKNNPMIFGELEKNIMEHISLMAQEQVEIEMIQEIQQIQQLTQQVQMMQQNPQMAQQNPQAQQQLEALQNKVESRIAVLVAQLTEEFLNEEKKINNMLDGDPLVKLKAQELDLKAMENERKAKDDEARINLDKVKLIQGDRLARDKMEQTEDIANLRAKVTMDKQHLANKAKRQSDLTKRYDVRTLKGR